MVNVKELRINKNKNELTVTFDDGFSNTLSSELLRVESPSAEVQGHGPNQKKTPSQKSRVVIEDIEPVENYAVAIKFKNRTLINFLSLSQQVDVLLVGNCLKYLVMTQKYFDYY